MRLSIVTTLFHSSSYITEFYRRMSACAQELTDQYEIIFVNDGSPDNSFEIAVSLYEQDKRIKIIDLSRNFGHHKAIMTGLSYAKGDFVFLIDSDLEEEPELLLNFYEEIKKNRVDVVFGVQKKRKGDLIEKITGEIYYVLFNLLTGYNAVRNVLTARLMTQVYVQALIAHKEREFDIMGLWALAGFRQFPVAVNKHSKGDTVYNWRRKISLFLNTVTAFSSRPLFAIFFLGFVIFALANFWAFFLFTKQLLFQDVEGWSVVAVSVWLIGGLIILCLGTIGIYITKINIEAKQRPYTIVRQFYGTENFEQN